MATLQWRVQHPYDVYGIWTQGATPSRLFGRYPALSFDQWFEQAQTLYAGICAALNDERRRLQDRHGLAEHPKRDLMWDRVWREVRDGGGEVDDVADCYADLAELLK